MVLLWPALLRRAESHAPSEIVGQVSVVQRGLFGPGEKKDRSGVVVFLLEVKGAGSRPMGQPAIVQKDKSFAPRLLVVPLGAEVDFPNQDKIFHNVFSLSETTKFDLGLYKSGSSKRVKMEQPGIIDVYCNIHPDMVATIRVVPNPYFAVTGPDGTFQLKNVPPGTYPIVAWMPRSDEVRATVTVTAGQKTQVQLKLIEGTAAARHARKDGSPYGRYQ